MDSPRRRARVNHLSVGLLVKRMLSGRFTVAELVEVCGLTRTTILEMVSTFERQGLLVYLGKTADVTKTGRRDKQYEIARAAVPTLTARF